MFWDKLGMKVKIIWSYGHIVVCNCKLRSNTLKGDGKDQAELIADALPLSWWSVLNSTLKLVTLYSSWFYVPFFLMPVEVTLGQGKFLCPTYLGNIGGFMV